MTKRVETGGQKTMLKNSIIAESIETFFPKAFQNLDFPNYQQSARVKHNKGNAATWERVKSSIKEKHGVEVLKTKLIAIRWNQKI
jgi:hypothetical protein